MTALSSYERGAFYRYDEGAPAAHVATNPMLPRRRWQDGIPCGAHAWYDVLD